MRTTNLLRIAVAFAVTVSAVVLIVSASESLRWRYLHDSPLMIYAGFLVAGGSAPYRDFFDPNMPGTYLAMAAMGRVFGWDDLGFRVFDLLCLTTIAVCTFVWTRRFGNLAAVAASVAFPLWYLIDGPGTSMQREYMALVPFSGMLAVGIGGTRLKPWLQMSAVGFLAGMAALIKPQFLLLSLPLLVFLLRPGSTQVGVRRRIAAFAVGGAIPVGSVFLYLLRVGSLGPFLEMVVNYWPLFTALNGQHMPISGLPRLIYIVKSTGNGLLTFYVPMAVIGLMTLDRDQLQRPYAWLLGGLVAAAGLYPALAGQFFWYHYIPFQYVGLCAASLAARIVPITTVSIGGIAPALCVILLLSALSSLSARQMTSWSENGGDRPIKNGVPDEVAQFLRSNMNPGDTVQPLDWTGGAVHGMLMARAPLATRFMYDFHFYHHVSRPYIQELRTDFMSELAARKPRFIIQVTKDKPWPIGPDTTREFPELTTFLERHYAPAREAAAYRILQRRD
ncbi:MAG TPA: hypothetical protein VF424_06425 [Vicinamibacterales bacterium]